MVRHDSGLPVVCSHNLQTIHCRGRRQFSNFQITIWFNSMKKNSYSPKPSFRTLKFPGSRFGGTSRRILYHYKHQKSWCATGKHAIITNPSQRENYFNCGNLQHPHREYVTGILRNKSTQIRLLYHSAKNKTPILCLSRKSR